MHQVSAGLRGVLGMTQWRTEHPKATWAEIEAAVDERINQLRAQLIQDMVQMGESEEWSQKPDEERPRCATCEKPLWARGEQTRFLQTMGGEAVKLTRMYGTYPACGVGFSPLDEQLGLVSGGLTPCGDYHRADAQRILDFAHAASAISDIGETVRAAGGRLPATWLFLAQTVSQMPSFHPCGSRRGVCKK